MMNLTSEGEALKRMDMIKLFKQTVLPEPVVPATSKCGMSARSTTKVCRKCLYRWPNQSLKSTGRECAWVRTSFKKTAAEEPLGTSTPTLFLPGIGAKIRTADALKAMCQIIGQTGNALDFDSGRRLQFITGDHGPAFNIRHLDIDPEIAQGFFQNFCPVTSLSWILSSEISEGL